MSYLSSTLTNLCTALYWNALCCIVSFYNVLLNYCYTDIIQYNAMHKFVRVLDNPQKLNACICSMKQDAAAIQPQFLLAKETNNYIIISDSSMVPFTVPCAFASR